MIRFVAGGRRGKVLGLGLSFGNLDLLAGRKPIVFDLAPYASRGSFVIACGTVDEVVRFVEASGLKGSFIVRVDDARLDRLRAGEALPLDLAELGVPGFADAIVFAGPTEFEIIDSLRAAGLVAPDTNLEGLEEYRRHEAGEVEGCPLCQARAHRRSPDTAISWNELLSRAASSQPVTAPPSATPRPSWRAIARTPLAKIFAITLVAGTVVGVLLSVARPKQAGSRSERLSEAQVKERARIVEAEKPRIAFLESPDWQRLSPPLTNDPCGVRIALPHPLGSLERHVVQMSGSLRDRGLGASLSAYALYGPRFDLIPPSAGSDSAPGRRIGATPADGDKLPQMWPTLVVEGWTDAEFPAGAGAAPPTRRPIGPGYRLEDPDPIVPSSPGRVRARLLVWGYAEQRWICGSEPVEVETPPVKLVPGADLGLVARLETVLAAYRAGVPMLRTVAADGAGSAP